MRVSVSLCTDKVNENTSLREIINPLGRTRLEIYCPKNLHTFLLAFSSVDHVIKRYTWKSMRASNDHQVYMIDDDVR